MACKQQDAVFAKHLLRVAVGSERSPYQQPSACTVPEPCALLTRLVNASKRLWLTYIYVETLPADQVPSIARACGQILFWLQPR